MLCHMAVSYIFLCYHSLSGEGYNTESAERRNTKRTEIHRMPTKKNWEKKKEVCLVRSNSLVIWLHSNSLLLLYYTVKDLWTSFFLLLIIIIITRIRGYLFAGNTKMRTGEVVLVTYHSYSVIIANSTQHYTTVTTWGIDKFSLNFIKNWDCLFVFCKHGKLELRPGSKISNW